MFKEGNDLYILYPHFSLSLSLSSFLYFLCQSKPDRGFLIHRERERKREEIEERGGREGGERVRDREKLRK